MAARKAFVTMSQWVMHRDARYFPEPERFMPARWENDLEKNLPGALALLRRKVEA